jgi:hypothetical protein
MKPGIDILEPGQWSPFAAPRFVDCRFAVKVPVATPPMVPFHAAQHRATIRKAALNRVDYSLLNQCASGLAVAMAEIERDEREGNLPLQSTRF